MTRENPARNARKTGKTGKAANKRSGDSKTPERRQTPRPAQTPDRPGTGPSRTRARKQPASPDGSARRDSVQDDAAAVRRPEARAPEALEPTDASTQPEPFMDDEQDVAPPIVGIGASAGGLEALSQFLSSLQADTGMAFVIVQHLAPKHSSLLAQLLAGNTPMPCVQVSDDVPIEANHVYVIPPNTNLRIDGGRLRLSSRPEYGTFLPIDSFFRSLAEFGQSSAIGIVLSGTASDGAEGLREIKAAGGITIAQDPSTARYDGMPRAAIATGLVDLVLPPEEIACELDRIRHHAGTRTTSAETAGREIGILDDQMRRIFQMLRNATGVDFSHYKQPTIRRRLQRRMVLHRLSSVQDYVHLLQADPGEVRNLYRDILIHVTRFFRDPESYEALAREVFPRLKENLEKDLPIRIWVPGCSTGEEVYSIAMLLVETLGGPLNSPVQIFGTDVSETAVAHARAGLYPGTIAADVNPERQRRFFSRVDGGYKVLNSIRDLCIFARQDVTRDPPFSKLDLVVCRNVLIYLDSSLQRKLIGVFHYALNPNGYLMLGSAETTGPHAELFTAVDKKQKLYTKKPVGSRAAADMSIPPAEAAVQPMPARRAPDSASGTDLQNEAGRILQNRYAPPAVVVDDDFQILQFRGQTGAYLEPAPGEASLSLLKMAREGLLYGLRGTLNEARKNQKPARKEGLRVRADGILRAVNLQVVPLSPVRDQRHYLVIFEDAAHSHGGPKAEQAPEPRAGKGARKRDEGATVGMLQQELASSREYLQSIIQDLEAANEELQSANEEILSANEELQSTNEELDTAKEELQSTNEEINTVNEEMHARNEELSLLNSDLVNLLASVNIPIVMVSNDLRIRRFTPMAEKVLNFIPSDLGRPISDIKPNISSADLEARIIEAIDSMAAQECEVQDSDGRWYSLRVRPYRSLENRIDGAVVSLIDIDSLRKGEALSRDLNAYAEILLESCSSPVLVTDGGMRIRAINGAFVREFRIQRSEAVNRALPDLGGAWASESLRGLLLERLPREEAVEGFEVEGDFPPAGPRSLRIRARRLTQDGGDALEVLLLETVDGATGEEANRQDRTGGAT